MTIDFSRSENKVIVSITDGPVFEDVQPDGYEIEVDSLNNRVVITSEANGKKYEINLNSDTVTVNEEAFSGTASELKTLLYSDVFTVDYSTGGSSVVGYPEGTKMYVALLTQSGTDAPVATVLVNTLGGTVVWTRDSAGQYVGTLAGAFPDIEKVFGMRTAYLNGGDGVNTFALYRVSENTVAINIWDVTSGDFVDLLAPRIPIQILVFP